MSVAEMLASEGLDALWVVGANPLKDAELRARPGFMVVQDLFLTETAQIADVVLPAASAYEKTGTVTNVCGEVQRLKKAAQTMGAKPDLEIIGLIAKEMGAAAAMGPWLPDTVFQQIRKTVQGYDLPLELVTLGAVPLAQVPLVSNGHGSIESAHNTLFT